MFDCLIKSNKSQVYGVTAICLVKFNILGFMPPNESLSVTIGQVVWWFCYFNKGEPNE